VPDVAPPAPNPGHNHKFSARSELRLTGVNPALVAVVRRALELSPVPFIVLEGVRSLERQKQLYAQGRTAPGKIVTSTMHSRHLTGHAVDLGPVNLDGVVVWDDKKAFLAIGKAMFTAADELHTLIRWGWDWDGDKNLMEKGEYDGPHFELAREAYP
jgi:hypothetical protein